MKKTLYILLTGFFAIGLLTRCEDLVDIKQPDALAPSLQLTKIATYEGLINSAYDRMQAFAYYPQRMMLAPDALADNAVLVNNTGRYVGELVNQRFAHLNLWFLHAAINDCNIVINNIKANIVAPGEQARAEAAIAQAYFIRGLCYFDMARVHAYEPNHIVGGFDEGLILSDVGVIDIEDVNNPQLSARANITETYEFIENSLQLAIDSVEAGAVIPNQPFRPSLAAMHGILAKVYFYWGRYDDALTEIAAVLATKPAAIRLATAAEYVPMWTGAAIATGRVESLFELRIFPGSTGTNGDWSTVDGVNESLHSMTTTGITNASQFVLAASPSLMAAHTPSDVRLGLYQTVLVRGQNYNMIRKWPGTSSAPGHWADNIPVLRMADIYLMRAESFFHEDDEPNALIALNEVRTRRGLAALTAATTGDALFAAILNEFRLEFAFEGHRWFDLKRNGLNITKDIGDPLLYTDYRILAPVPLNETILNPSLVQNPGY